MLERLAVLTRINKMLSFCFGNRVQAWKHRSARLSEHGWTERWRECEKENSKTRRTHSLNHAESGVEQKDRAGWAMQQTGEQNAFPLPKSLDPAFLQPPDSLVKSGRTFPVSTILCVPNWPHRILEKICGFAVLHLFFKMESYVDKFNLFPSPTLRHANQTVKNSGLRELLLINEKCSSDCMGDGKKAPLRLVKFINS